MQGQVQYPQLLLPVMFTPAPARQEAAEKWPGRAHISPARGVLIPSLAGGEHSFTWWCYGVPAHKSHWKFIPSAAHPLKGQGANRDWLFCHAAVSPFHLAKPESCWGELSPEAKLPRATRAAFPSSRNPVPCWYCQCNFQHCIPGPSFL